MCVTTFILACLRKVPSLEPAQDGLQSEEGGEEYIAYIREEVDLLACEQGVPHKREIEEFCRFYENILI